MNSIANVTLSSVNQVLAEVEYGCPAWFGLLHPHLLLDTKGLLAAMGGGGSTKIPGTDPSHWDIHFICCEFSDVFEKLDTPPERAIKH